MMLSRESLFRLRGFQLLAQFLHLTEKNVLTSSHTSRLRLQAYLSSLAQDLLLLRAHDQAGLVEPHAILHYHWCLGLRGKTWGSDFSPV